MECPLCRLANPESATRCDCGYNFQTRSIESPVGSLESETDALLRRIPLPRMWIGFALSVLTLASEFIDFGSDSEQAASRGNPIFFGLVVISWIYWLWCVHRFHDILGSIPGYRHPISPGQAVARHFIPVYNFYWVFKWPSEIDTFVNWRTQAAANRGWIVGALVLLGVLMRVLDASFGMAIVFAAGAYLSRMILKALTYPPVPATAMAPPGPTPTLGLS
jgi:hypothetical protein